MNCWQQSAFAEVVQSRGSGAAGLPQSEWAPHGKYPVIGQGAEYIEGWTDREDLLITPNPALVLYGGHTRRAKFVDRPFVPGPNVKILEPAPVLSAAFLFRYLEQLKIESRGYADHFPEVRRRRLPVPSLPEQRRIAEILDKADALRAKRRAALAQLDTLTQSIFLDMFGDPATNPKGWPIRKFDETIRDETSKAKKLQRSDYLPEGRYPVVDQGQSIIAGYCDDKQLLCPSDLPVIVFGDHTRAVKLVRHPFVVGADGAKVLAPQPGVDAVFLAYLLRVLPIPNLGYSRHMREVKRLTFPVPRIERQREFAQRIASVELHRETHGRSQLEIDSLFASLRYRAFQGEL